MSLYLLLSGILLQCCMHPSAPDDFNTYIRHYKPQEISQKAEITLNHTIDESYVRQYLEPEYESDRFNYAYGIVDTLYDDIIITVSCRFNDNDVDPEFDPTKDPDSLKNIDPEFGLSEYVITTYDMLGNFISQIRVGKFLDGYSPGYVSRWNIVDNKIFDTTVGPIASWELPEETTMVERRFSIGRDGRIRQIGENRIKNILFTRKELNSFLGL